MYQMITAHSGCEGTERDSMESIDKALELNADAIEVDVRLGEDGLLRITHNLESEDVYKTKHTINDVFSKIKDTNLLINCDVKESKVLYRLIDVAKEYGIGSDRLIITGCTSPEMIASDPDILKKTMCYINLETMCKYEVISRQKTASEIVDILNDQNKFFMDDFVIDSSEMDRIIEYCKKLGVYGLNLFYGLLTEEFAEKLNKADLLFSAWTINDYEIAKKIFSLNAKNVTTRNVTTVMKARSDYEVL